MNHVSAFPNCKKPVCAAKQFNCIVIRVYLCREHLLQVAKLNSDNHQDAELFMRLLNNEK